MSLALSCPCGAHFEVEEHLARQTVACPECQQPVQAPGVSRRPLRTSGWAVAGTVSGLVLAFTGIGTVLAVVFGIIGLVSIARNRGQIAGTGYAVFSIVWGILFTGLFTLAVVKGELFGVGEGVREGLMGKEVERGGPMEVRRPANNFALTRPGPKWYVAKPSLAEKLTENASDLVLVNLARNAYIHVSIEQLGWGKTLDSFRDDMVGRFRDSPPFDFTSKKPQTRLSNLTVRENKRIPAAGNLERADILLDVKIDGEWRTFLVRMIRDPDSNQVYIIQAWAERRGFPAADAEIRRALDSFRLLNQQP